MEKYASDLHLIRIYNFFAELSNICDVIVLIGENTASCITFICIEHIPMDVQDYRSKL